uniref:ArfGAP with FG repeats 1b n=1 Tax=Xiphophorus couchianus TaxID=32473 RepID=A0A3B5LP77_9TELE
MATSAKRKQEETHLKMLREMTSLPANRKCFDCDQRGPTYVNMTVGSFVCTTCSGILRGLNPPHRVKSISMTTFTQQEIEFLQKHGNEVCKHIWLGLYDDRTSVVPDFREPQKVKEFLQEKYEKKRWYVPPDQAKAVASVQGSVSGSSASSTGSTPEVQPLKTLQLNKTPLRQVGPSPGLSRPQAHSTAQEKKFDLLSDLGGDIFAAPPTQAGPPSTNFANFAHFPSQSGKSAPDTLLRSSITPYNFLPCLFYYYYYYYYFHTLFSTLWFLPWLQHLRVIQTPTLPTLNRSVIYNIQADFYDCFVLAVPSTNPFVAAAIAPDMASNPFQANGRGPAAASFGTGSMSMPAGFGNASSYCLPTSFSGNFQQQFPGQAPIPYSQPGAYHPQSNGPAFPVYSQNKPSITPFGQPMAVPGMTSNPFMVSMLCPAFSTVLFITTQSYQGSFFC